MSNQLNSSFRQKEEIAERYARRRSNFLPWESRKSDAENEQLIYQEVLRELAGAKSFGEGSFVSPEAHIYTHHFEIGNHSWIAGGAVVRGKVIIGNNCSINPFAHIAGDVKIEDGVRIAGLVSIYGFNHGFARSDLPIYLQPHTSDGVLIGEGTWIGANVIVVDGVKVGAHCVIAGGSVITKNIPSYSVAAGNPARVLRDRRGNNS